MPEKSRQRFVSRLKYESRLLMLPGIAHSIFRKVIQTGASSGLSLPYSTLNMAVGADTGLLNKANSDLSTKLYAKAAATFVPINN